MELPAEVSSSVAGSGLDGKSATNGTLGGGLEVTGSGCDVFSKVTDSGTGSGLAASFIMSSNVADLPCSNLLLLKAFSSRLKGSVEPELVLYLSIDLHAVSTSALLPNASKHLLRGKAAPFG